MVLRVALRVTVPLLHVGKLALAVGVVLALGYALQVPTGGLVGKLAIVGKLGVLTAGFVAVVLVTRAVTVAQLRGLRRG